MLQIVNRIKKNIIIHYNACPCCNSFVLLTFFMALLQIQYKLKMSLNPPNSILSKFPYKSYRTTKTKCWCKMVLKVYFHLMILNIVKIFFKWFEDDLITNKTTTTHTQKKMTTTTKQNKQKKQWKLPKAELQGLVYVARTTNEQLIMGLDNIGTKQVYGTYAIWAQMPSTPVLKTCNYYQILIMLTFHKKFSPGTKICLARTLFGNMYIKQL